MMVVRADEVRVGDRIWFRDFVDRLRDRPVRRQGTWWAVTSAETSPSGYIRLVTSAGETWKHPAEAVAVQKENNK